MPDAKGIHFVREGRGQGCDELDLFTDREGLECVQQKYFDWASKQIPLNSYTMFRLEHSTPDHMDRSSRVMVVGPLAKEWIEQSSEKVLKKYAGSSLGPFFSLASRVFPLDAISKPQKYLSSKINKKGDDLLEELMEAYDSSGSELTDDAEAECEVTGRCEDPEEFVGSESEESDVAPSRFLSAQKKKTTIFRRPQASSSFREKSKTFNHSVKDMGSFQGSKSSRRKTTMDFSRIGASKTFSDQISSPGKRVGTFMRSRSNSKGKSIMTDSDSDDGLFDDLRHSIHMPTMPDLLTPIVKLPGFGSTHPHGSAHTRHDDHVTHADPSVTARDFSRVEPPHGEPHDELHAEPHEDPVSDEDTAYKPPVGVISQERQGSAKEHLRKFSDPFSDPAPERPTTPIGIDQKPPTEPAVASSLDTMDSFHSADSNLSEEDLSDEFGPDDATPAPQKKSILVAPKASDIVKGTVHREVPPSPVSESKVKFTAPAQRPPHIVEEPQLKEEEGLPANVAVEETVEAEAPPQSDYYVQFQENFVSKAKTVAGKVKGRSTRAREATIKNWRFLRGRTAGEIVKIEKMLVMVKTSTNENLPKDFNEMESSDTRVMERWREYIVVARSTGDPENPISLQFYSSRSIKAVEKVTSGKTGAKMFLTLGSHVQVSLYSSLDKTIALWYRGKRETVIYILRARSAFSSIRWFAFFSEILGARRGKDIHVRVPDLAVVVTVRVSWRRFRQIDEMISRNLMATDSDQRARHTALMSSRAHDYIKGKTLKALLDNPRFKTTVEDWVQNKRVGLGWRRYDRLEWVQGFGEKDLHGSWALHRTHDLELRVKEHYGDKLALKTGEELVEPTPIEGHLVRLKSWKGEYPKKSSFGKLLFKNLYFSTHDYYLYFSKPGNAMLPLPDEDLKCQEAYNESQREWVYEIAPFKTAEGTGVMEGLPTIKWLKSGMDEAEFQKRDTIALHNMQRRAAQIVKADGFINLLEVTEVRATKRQEGNIDREVGDEDNNVDYDGSDILHGTADGEDGVVESFDDAKTFELVMENGLVVRLQAYNTHCRNLWVTRLKELVSYWKVVAQNQLQVSADLRTKNMKRLFIDDKLDAAVGESSPKWETARASASTTLYNVSGISWSRSIISKGLLYHKTTTHGAFKLYHAVLCHGHLLLYDVYRRTIGGVPVNKVNYARCKDIPLKEAYVYSGNIAESDIQNRDETCDVVSDRVVPRIYKDGWKSAESEILRCIILWFPRKKAITSNSSIKLRVVNRLGVSGHRFIFVARSRQEKEQWVMALSHEIEKLVEPDFADINIVE